MSKKPTILIAVLAILYVICPDLFPGPIDDLIVLVLAWNSIQKAKEADED